MKPKDHLKEARIRAGYKNPTDAARALKEINQNTLISNENDNRPISRETAENTASFLVLSLAEFYSAKVKTVQKRLQI